MEKRKHKTKEEKQILVSNYLESDLSKNAWCRKNNIPISRKLKNRYILKFRLLSQHFSIVFSCF